MSVLSVLLLVWGIGRLVAQPAPAGEIQQSIRKLNEMGTVLMIGAHPDDENTGVLAYFARGRYMRTAYLSLNRGEGGQNLIGPEQGAALGIIRTQEILAARRIDGAEQFFTRAIDFGFSKTADETMQKWGHEQELSDVVWVIRKYRPDVIILCFTGTDADGHGHHQASAILGKEAYDAAGDPSRFPEQLKYLQPWKAARIVSSAYGRGGTATPVAPDVQIDITGYSSALGYTYLQLAGISRAQHRSQGMAAAGLGGGMGFTGGGRGGTAPGATPNPAPAAAPKPPAVNPAWTADLFDGIEHSWKRLPGGVAVDAILSRAERDFDWEHPEKSIPLLASARPLIAAIPDPRAQIKVADLDETIARCAGIWADAQVHQASAAPGMHIPVAVTVTPRLPVEVRVKSVRAEGLWAAQPWTPAPMDPKVPDQKVLPDYDLAIPDSQPYTQPYWLIKPAVSGRYTIDDPTLVGRPDPVVELLRIELTVMGTTIQLTRPIVYRYNDRLEGEKSSPLAIVPEVSVNVPLSPDLSSSTALFPTTAARKLQVTVRANFANAAGELRIEVPSGWKADPASQTFSLGAADDQKELAFEVTPPAGESSGTLRAVAVVGGRRIAVGMTTIAYPHIQAQNVFPPSEIKLQRSDVRVTAKRVGYIMGAGDDVPGALRQLGLEVTLLGEDDLRKSDLSRFDAIVAGVRAYNVRADLRANNQRLMDYVNNGGTYVVQYESAGAQNIGPYPITIPAGNAFRVTVEEAPVRFPHPDSPLLQMPNRIQDRDFEGWVQERGLLFSTEWDSHYETVLSSNDPGDKPLDGGELWTHYGKGVYVFTAWAWFRELPAGVPGAFRLFANLLSAR